jgi:predicted NACHT family NTPase
LPREEEFNKVLERYQNTRKPLISVYFKKEPFYPTNEYENEQFVAVLDFQERIKALGFYGEFEASEFQNKVLVDIACKIPDWAVLTAPPNPKLAHTEAPNYIRRKIAPAKKYDAAGFSFLLTEYSMDIVDVIAQHNRIVLLGNAGVGKTTELQRIRDYFSKAGSSFAPFFVPLNRYVDDTIPQLLGPTWTAVPKNQLVIVMDGSDEIEAKNRNDAIRRMLNVEVKG